MRKLIGVLAILVLCGIAYAHGTYQGKSFTFQGGGHTIDVLLEQNNQLTVFLDNETLGTRSQFCTPTD